VRNLLKKQSKKMTEITEILTPAMIAETIKIQIEMIAKSEVEMLAKVKNAK